MAADIDTFLDPVIEDACKLLQMFDPATDELVKDHPMVDICARIAYAQAESYLNRRLAIDDFVEYYLDQDTRIRLRNTPVDFVNKVWFVDNVYHGELTNVKLGAELVRDVDYQIQRQKSLLILKDVSYTPIREFVTGADELDGRVSRSPGIHILVEYAGGWESAADIPALRSALVMQTVANYNRKDTLGVMQLQAAGGGSIITSRSSPDSGQLIEGAQLIFDSYRYYGMAEEA